MARGACPTGRIMKRVGVEVWLLVVLLAGGMAAGGTVHLRDGKVHEGSARLLEGGKVQVSGAGGAGMVVDLAQVQEAVFDAPPAAPVPPAQWQSADVGRVRQAGKVQVAGQRMEIEDFGTGFGRKEKGADSFFMAYQRLRGDGQMVARVLRYEGDQGGRSGARVGLMIRENLESQSPLAMVGRGGGDRGQSSFYVRRLEGEEVEAIGGSERPILGATWLKLVRRGDEFLAYESADGQKWVGLGQCSVLMPDQAEVYVGLASASLDEGQGWSVFDHVEIQRGGPGARQGAAEALLTRGGSLLACQIVKGDMTSVSFVRKREPQRTILTAEVSAIVFRSLSEELAGKLAAAAGSGVLMASGDFVEGQLREVEDRRVKVSSVLFGLKNLDARREVAAVALRPKAAGPCAWEVRLHDGSVLRAEAVEIEKDQVTIKLPALDSICVPVGEVAEMRRGR